MGQLEKFAGGDVLDEDAGRLADGAVAMEGDVGAVGRECRFAGFVGEIDEGTDALNGSEGIVAIGGEGDFLEEKRGGEEKRNGESDGNEVGMGRKRPSSSYL